MEDMMVRSDKENASSAAVGIVTGMVNQQLLLLNEYLITENRILRSHLIARLRLTDPQRATLAMVGKARTSGAAAGRLGRRNRRPSCVGIGTCFLCSAPASPPSRPNRAVTCHAAYSDC